MKPVVPVINGILFFEHSFNTPIDDSGLEKSITTSIKLLMLNCGTSLKSLFLSTIPFKEVPIFPDKPLI